MILVVLLAVPIRAIAAEDTTQGWLTGVVTDEVGARVSGATVELLSGRRVVVRKVTADEDGRFEMRDIAPGNYRLQATALGFRRQLTKRFRVAAGKQHGFYITLEVKYPADEISPPMPAEQIRLPAPAQSPTPPN